MEGAILKGRAVSPILATLILAAIVISAGIYLYAQASGILHRWYSRIDVQIVSLDLYKFEDKVLLSVSVKNTGSKPLAGIVVSGYDDNGKSFSLALPPADPGSTTSNSLIIPLGVSNIVLDGSGNNYHGTIYGASWVDDPVLGTCLSFDGANDYLDVDFLSDVQEWDELSVSLWVKLLSTPDSIADSYIGSPAWSNEGGLLVYTGTSGHVSARLRNDPLDTETACLFEDNVLSEWRCYAFTFNRPTLKTYVNGGFAHQATWDYPVRTDGHINIGRWGGGYQHCIIDEIRIYSIAVSDAKISFVNANPELPPTEGLVLWLPLNEGSNNPFSFTSGDSYPITVTAYSLDGDVYVKTVSAVCS